jgi:Predicted membrane protein
VLNESFIFLPASVNAAVPSNLHPARVFSVNLGIISYHNCPFEVKSVRKYRSCLAAPAAVIGILLSIFFYYGMYPFGDLTLAWCDMNQQVIPFLMDIKDIFSGKANLFLNLQNAGGMSFWGVFLFFISSPFTFLVTLVSKQEIYHLVNLLVLLKMAVCGFTASIFFRRQFRNLNLLQNLSLSLMYAFSGYAMFYYQNQVWLDIMYLFPVLLIGLVRLVEQGRTGLYIFAFSAILTVNFYLSYMVSIFLVLSFGLSIFLCMPKDRRGKSTLLLGISTLLVMLITAVVWLPSLLQYLHSARTGDILSNIRSGGFFTQWETSDSLILCTGALIAAIAFYFRSASLRRSKQARFLFCIILLTLIPVLIDPVNKMWHTGSYQAFPVRYGYIPVFFGLLLYAMQLTETGPGRPLRRGTAVASVVFGVLSLGLTVALAFALIDKKYKTLTIYTRTLWCNRSSFFLVLLFSLAAGLAYYAAALLCRKKGVMERAGSVLLCAAALTECVFNATVYVVSPANQASNYSSITDLADKIQDDGLYRVKTEQKYFEVNLTGGIGYDSLSHYTSLTDQDYLFFMKKMGYSSYWMEVNSNGGTEFSDAILGNRYSIVKTGDIQDTDRILYSNNQYAIRRSPFDLPIGLVMNAPNIASIRNLPQTTRTGIQQSVFQSIFHTGDTLFTDYEPQKLINVDLYAADGGYSISLTDPSQYGMITYSIPVTDAETLYFDCFDRLSNRLTEPVNGSFQIYVNGSMVQMNYPSQNNNALLNLGTFANRTVTVQAEVLKDVHAASFGVSGLHRNILQKAVGSAATAKLRQEGNSITGTAAANSDGDYLFLPLNYDGGGYTASVNGQTAPIVRVFDSMMAVRLVKGENQISVRYMPPGFVKGIWISVLGILLLIGYRIAAKKGCYQKIRFLEFPAEILFSILFAGIFFAVYIFPLIIYFIR